MATNQMLPLLNVEMKGPAIQDGRILLDDLLQFVSNIGVAIERIVNVLETGTGVRQGRPPRGVQLLSALEVVAISRGSFSLDLDLRRGQPLLPDFDIGENAVEKLVTGLPIVADNTLLPEGFDNGVLTALREAGRVFDRGIDSALLNLARLPNHSGTMFTGQTRDRVVSRIRRLQQTWATVEGRLLMADVRETNLRCRLHPSIGDSIFCDFPEYLTPYVMRNLRQFVRARGEAVLESATGKIRSLTVLDLEPIDQPTVGAPQVTSTSFWGTKTFDELAQEQGVYPIVDWERLTGAWPQDADFDYFLNAVRESRS